MSKQLLVMRHAKSSWANANMTDFERPLNKRGLRVMPQMAEFIHLQGLTPDLIVSSTANRAQSTSKLFVEHCKDIELENLVCVKDFYHAPAETYLKFLNEFTVSKVNKLMFVGHNPGLEELVEKLAGEWQIMATAAVAHFDLNIETWQEFSIGASKLKNFWCPKDLGID